ncbi:MAG: HD domain-containing protein [Adhaeribacter sp.]
MDFPFHNLAHTRQVVQAAAQLARRLQLPDPEKEIVLIAAWFHDTGYSHKYQGHEAASQGLALDFLSLQQYPREKVTAVLGCIGATQMPQRPASLAEQILCDADLAHLSSPVFIARQNELRREWALYLDRVYTDAQWLAESLAFFKSHRYHTPYAQEHWETPKAGNIRLLQKQMAN